MKKLLSIALLSSLFPLPFSLFAMPLKWQCNFPEARSQTFSVYQGETVTFEPTFRVNGVVTNLAITSVYYQTNGMASTWWKLDGNVFAPENDVGAASYRFFIDAAAAGGGKNYRANGTLKMLPSPGFVAATTSPPGMTLDFAEINYENAPWVTADYVAKNTLGIKWVGNSCYLTNNLCFSGGRHQLGMLNVGDKGDTLVFYSEGDVLIRSGQFWIPTWNSLRIESGYDYPEYAQTLPEYVGGTVTNIVRSVVPETVINVVRDVQGLVYDEKLGITWKQTMYDGNLYYIAVTNANVTEVE